MLERISNISLETDFKKSKKGRYSNFKGKLYANTSFEINDSISFSPASKYLSRANWILKEFHQPSDENVVVEFIYSGFFFEVSVNLLSINEIDAVTYIIRKENSIISEYNPITTTLRVGVGVGENNSSLPLQKELKGLEQLFQRLSSLNLKSELNIYNYELIDTLLEGIYSLLQSDFTYLNNVLFNFLEKQTNKKIISLLSKNKGTTELNIQKIKPYLIS